MTPGQSFGAVTRLFEALIVRRLRNDCARYMTGSQEPIGWWAQVRWYLRHYRRARREGRYRVFLLREGSAAVGYGALRLSDGELLITECVAAEHRGRGAGTAILDELIAIARREGRDLIAEIWASNRASVGLHEKAGFVLEETRAEPGGELNVYRLAAGRPGPPTARGATS